MGTVTISIEEFDRLRKLESDIKKLPKVTLCDIHDMNQIKGWRDPTFYFSQRAEFLYTTDESQREMLTKINENLRDAEGVVRKLKGEVEKMQIEYEIQKLQLDSLAYSRKARKEYIKNQSK